MTRDTDIGGPNHRFPQTSHSTILGISASDAATREQSRAAIIDSYWKPVYKYLRLRWNASNEDAKDLTQTFFARTLERETLTAFDPAKASFRTYLRVCLDRMVLNERSHAARLKRGGPGQLAPLHFEAASEESLDELFHREWLRGLFETALEDLRAASLANNKQIQFAIFEAYDLCPDPPPPSYNQLAERHGITPATVTNYLAGMRRDLRKAIFAIAGPGFRPPV